MSMLVITSDLRDSCVASAILVCDFSLLNCSTTSIKARGLSQDRNDTPDDTKRFKIASANTIGRTSVDERRYVSI